MKYFTVNPYQDCTVGAATLLTSLLYYVTYAGPTLLRKEVDKEQSTYFVGISIDTPQCSIISLHLNFWQVT